MKKSIVAASKKEKIILKKIHIISSMVLIILLILYLIMTLFSTGQYNQQIKLMTQHPFVVIEDIHKIKVGMAKMSIRMERIQSCKEVEERKEIEKSIDTIYEQIEQALSEIKTTYLGPEVDSINLEKSLMNLKTMQNRLLDYNTIDDLTKERILKYEQEFIFPLYYEAEKNADVILKYAKDVMMTVYENGDVLQGKIQLGSILIVSAMVFVLLFFQYLLQKQNQKIYQKNQQFDLLSKTIQETFIIFDNVKNQCEFVSENSWNVLGILSKDWKEDYHIFYNYLDEETKKNLTEKISQNITTDSWEIIIKFKNPQIQKTQWILVQFYLTGEEQNKKYIITFTDQTENLKSKRALQDALAEAQSANQAKRDFLSHMSHEIRTPMNAIIGMTTIAAASIKDRFRVEECLSKISYSSKHLLRLINDILDMSRIEHNKMVLNYEPFDIYELINSITAIVYPQTKNKNVEFSETIIGFNRNTSFLGDPFRLNQVLFNLLSNAIKFTENGGAILLKVEYISFKNQKERVRFTVSDTGIGMSEDMLKRLYNPFEQEDSSILKKYGGTGLGMSITRNLVGLMNGSIDVESKLGKGTTFVVEIPLEKAVEKKLNIDLPTQMDLEKIDILIVDDELNACEHTAMLLEKMNICANWVLSGQEAIECITVAHENNKDFDVCFIDWNMPEMDGIETTRQIRKITGPDTLIIIITAYDWSEIEKEAKEAGVNGFISKPLFFSSVYHTLVNTMTNGSTWELTHSVDKTECLMGKCILVAEDDELNLETMRELLKLYGAKAEGVKNGQEAVEKFLAEEEGKYAAILMDIQMPVMNGYEATKQIRASKHIFAKTIPIIATTAYAYYEDISEALICGMNAHISKPVNIIQLCEALEKYIVK